MIGETILTSIGTSAHALIIQHAIVAQFTTIVVIFVISRTAGPIFICWRLGKRLRRKGMGPSLAPTVPAVLARVRGKSRRSLLVPIQ